MILAALRNYMSLVKVIDLKKKGEQWGENRGHPLTKN
jgi:hypothetical protein